MSQIRQQPKLLKMPKNVQQRQRVVARRSASATSPPPLGQSIPDILSIHLPPPRLNKMSDRMELKI